MQNNVRILLLFLIFSVFAFAKYLENFNFKDPLYFLLLIVLGGAIFVATYLRSSKTATVKYSLPLEFSGKQTTKSILAKWLSLSLYLVALLLMIIALANPRQAGKSTIPPQEGVDIMMVIDVSLSMAGQDFKPNRLEAAKLSAKDFIENRTSDRIGIVVFQGAPMLQCPLTLDYDSLLEFLSFIKIGMIGIQRTAIGDAIALASQYLKSSVAKSKVIILLTDGSSNAGVIPDPLVSARAAEKLGIRIYTIATAGEGEQKIAVDNGIFGTSYVTISNDIDEATLHEIAKITGGEFFRARNNIELDTIYGKINELEKTEFEKSVNISYDKKYRNYLFLSLLFILLGLISARLIFIKVP
ncbi:MAG: VWA domain-containing protein [Elusimicrobiaceae bacterium]|jgi:Ca-activated chloride channel homolog|nr:VWA domain-containing protein [Elusimicrobiaceae bacterium]MBT3954723.1 VWA domain-containing protein [Elusimicrobiaceae bacterium]MBT4008631.1 VWA domain-containing protein [Elusimicrobiaceae bacterium]MBT4402459.1 VWA domain-containing protein [Elusimicrobiaceae bacterium]MBT4439391.1 VWA domain-containing protein [Elusimicrobiaceae bacterium]